mgnify:CR=1 FL=1
MLFRSWRKAAEDAGLTQGRYTVLDQRKVVTARLAEGDAGLQIDAAHGSFDNDIGVIGATLKRILRGELLAPVDDLRGF